MLLLNKCEELRRNDPFVTSIDLKKYGKLEWDDTSHIAVSLANNTRVTELLLSLNRRHLFGWYGLLDTTLALFELEPESAIARSYAGQKRTRHKVQPQFYLHPTGHFPQQALGQAGT
jgi:hypothetical protein